MVDFSGKLKVLRISKRLTQEQLAERLGITKSLISAYETGIRSPSLDVLVKLARLLGVTTDFLLGIEKRKMLDVSNLTQNQVDIIYALIEELQAH